jgi:hypothetical protein
MGINQARERREESRAEERWVFERQEGSLRSCPSLYSARRDVPLPFGGIDRYCMYTYEGGV